MTPASGIVDRPSNYSVNEAVERLKKTLEAKGVTLFALIDHSADFDTVKRPLSIP